MDEQSPNMHFDPTQPGVVCIAADRYGHFQPGLENALRFIQKGDMEKEILRFLDDNVKAAERCTYIPDVTLFVFRFGSMKNVPVPDGKQPVDRYIRYTFFPFAASENRLPDKQLSLVDAVYSAHTKGTPDCPVSEDYLKREYAYADFLSEQNVRKDTYRSQAEYVLPLTAVETDHGCLLFSGNEVGLEGFKAFIQHVADNYFAPNGGFGHLKIYESRFLDRQMPALLDSAYVPHRYFPLKVFDFSPHRYIEKKRLPKEFISSMRQVYEHPLNPDAEGFHSFILDFKDNERTNTVVSQRNHDIYRLLCIARNGYMNVHEKPFTYFETLLPLAKKLERITQVKSAEQFNADDFRIHSLAIGRQAEAILHREFDVRGHRSIRNELKDWNLEFTVGRVKLDIVQRVVLSEGYAVVLPENDSPGNLRKKYCMMDKVNNCLKTSSKPFPDVSTYQKTNDGLLQLVKNGKTDKEKTRKHQTGKNGHLKI